MWRPVPSAFAVQPARLGVQLRKTFSPSRWGKEGRAMLAREGAPGPLRLRVRAAAAAGLSAARVVTHADAAALLGTSQMYAMHAGVASDLLGLGPPGHWVGGELVNKRVASGLHLLDVGAATGSTTSELAKLGFSSVTATEASWACCRRLRARPDIDYVFGPETFSLDSLRPEAGGPEHYDVISLLNVLDRCDDPYALLRGTISKLCPRQGGLLLFAVSRPMRPFVQPQGMFPSLRFRTGADSFSLLHDFFAPVLDHQNGDFEQFATSVAEALLDRCATASSSLVQTHGPDASPSRDAGMIFEIHKWTRFPYLSGPDHEGRYAVFDQLLLSIRAAPRPRNFEKECTV